MKILFLITTILFIQQKHNPFFYNKQLMLASNDGMIKEKTICQLYKTYSGGFKYVCIGGV